MACRSGCRTQDHDSWGECMRAANLRVAYCASHKGQDYTEQKKWDSELKMYGEARAAGLQPNTTKTPDIVKTMEAAY